MDRKGYGALRDEEDNSEAKLADSPSPSTFSRVVGIIPVRWRTLVAWVFLLLCCLPLMSVTMCGSKAPSACAFVAAFMAITWAFEVIPISITALVPIVLLPLAGVVNGEDVAKYYINNSGMLVIGTAIVSEAVRESRLHRRFALTMLIRYSKRPRLLFLSFMLATAFISMWLSNVATAVLMMPMAVETLRSMEQTATAKVQPGGTGNTRGGGAIENGGGNDGDDGGNGEKKGEEKSAKLERLHIEGEADALVSVDNNNSNIPHNNNNNYNADQFMHAPNLKTLQNFKVGLVLAIAYSCSLGGMSTITGTATNIAFKGLYQELYPNAPVIPWAQWLLYGFPLGLFFTLLVWMYFCAVYLRGSSQDFSFLAHSGHYLKGEYDKMGPMSTLEKIVMGHFIALIVLWVTGEPGFTKGWSEWFGGGHGFVTDGTTCIMVTLPLFLIPKPIENLTEEERASGRFVPILTEKIISKLPWDTLLLLGGGFALAGGFQKSGLTTCIASGLGGVSGWSYPGLVVLVSSVASLMSEFTSNVSTCTILFPIAAALAERARIHPLGLLIPMTLSASCSFCLPISTPPNSIAYNTKFFTTATMIKNGIALDFLGLALIPVTFASLGALVYGLNVNEFPEWADPFTQAPTLPPSL